MLKNLGIRACIVAGLMFVLVAYSEDGASYNVTLTCTASGWT